MIWFTYNLTSQDKKKKITDGPFAKNWQEKKIKDGSFKKKKKVFYML